MNPTWTEDLKLYTPPINLRSDRTNIRTLTFRVLHQKSPKMNTGDASTQPNVETPASTIQSGDMVLLKIPNGDIRGVKIEQDSYACPSIAGFISG